MKYFAKDSTQNFLKIQLLKSIFIQFFVISILEFLFNPFFFFFLKKASEPKEGKENPPKLSNDGTKLPTK